MKTEKKIVSISILIIIAGFLTITIPTVRIEPDEPIFMEEMVPMRDGVCLCTRIYLPGPGEYPAIITRTPYGIGAPGSAPDPTDLSQWPNDILHGYAYIAQDTRGRYASEGVDRLFYDDGPDGYDAVEWVASQPWCNGKVEIHGEKYRGPAEFHIYDNGVYLTFEGQWVKWEICRHWAIKNCEFFICRGELGRFVVMKRGSKIIATGRKVLFKT